jgi:hypothetical protein
MKFSLSENENFIVYRQISIVVPTKIIFIKIIGVGLKKWRAGAGMWVVASFFLDFLLLLCQDKSK